MVLKIIRGVLKIVAPAVAFYLLIGFVSQFPEMRKYPVFLEVWTSLKPLARAVATQLPSVFRKVDVSMLWVVAAILIPYFVVMSLLKRLENAIADFRVHAQRRKAEARLAATPPPRGTAPESRPAENTR